MLQLGKNNIKYLASGPDLVDGCKGLLGHLSTLDDDARSTAMQAAKIKVETSESGPNIMRNEEIEKKMRQ